MTKTILGLDLGAKSIGCALIVKSLKFQKKEKPHRGKAEKIFGL